MINDSRFQQLSTWIHQDMPEATITVASADASFRRYFRVTYKGKTHIAMDAPPEIEDCAPFIDVTQRLLNAGVHAPAIFRQDLAQGFLLLEDLGAKDYLDYLNQDSAEQLYGDALKALIAIQRADTKNLPEYDADFLMFEMQLMPEWFLQTHLNITPNHGLSQEQENTINHCLKNIVNKVLEQPQVFVHRDYHSRNLMLTEEHNPGVIDYQDAMLGPITYDLVSLLRDCYIQWPNPQVEAWVLNFKQQLNQSGVVEEMADVSDETFIEWFDYMGLQRHIKVLGVFARLHHRDGKSNYLNDLPLTLEYMMQVAQKYPETKPLYDLFNEWQIPAKINQRTNAS